MKIRLKHVFEPFFKCLLNNFFFNIYFIILACLLGYLLFTSIFIWRGHKTLTKVPLFVSDVRCLRFSPGSVSTAQILVERHLFFLPGGFVALKGFSFLWLGLPISLMPGLFYSIFLIFARAILTKKRIAIFIDIYLRCFVSPSSNF